MTEKEIICHSDVQFADRECWPAPNPSVATQCLLCISRGNCQRTAFCCRSHVQSWKSVKLDSLSFVVFFYSWNILE